MIKILALRIIRSRLRSTFLLLIRIYIKNVHFKLQVFYIYKTFSNLSNYFSFTK